MHLWLAIIACFLLLSTHQVVAVDRVYYVAVDELLWDYAPMNMDGATGRMFNNSMGMGGGVMSEPPSTWTVQGADRIGKVYKKALYQEYTDATFSIVKPRTLEWQHLGYLGPLLRAVVGDTIKVVFRNNAANQPYSMHPHGVFYDKPNEGASYNSKDDMMAMDGNSVMPGMEWTYVWTVPERAGPGPNDASSIVWLYHSHVQEVSDTNAGLVGPIIITTPSKADPATTKPTDITREFVVMFTIVDENMSWYFDVNIKTFLPSMNSSSVVTLKMDSNFQMSNMKHAVNGYLYSNLPGLDMYINDTVRWYIVAVGDEPDIHGVHWHGQVLLHEGHHVDSLELIPTSMKTLDMLPDNPGTWLFHCHTNHHVTAGMSALFTVRNCPTQCPRATPHPMSTGVLVSPLLVYLYACIVITILLL
jgi:FtsP/CotA-like multicopper oxidase with cupredoxin domain